MTGLIFVMIGRQKAAMVPRGHAIELLADAYDIKHTKHKYRRHEVTFTDHATCLVSFDDISIGQLLAYAAIDSDAYTLEPFDQEQRIGRANASLRKGALFLTSRLVRINWLTVADITARGHIDWPDEEEYA